MNRYVIRPPAADKRDWNVALPAPSSKALCRLTTSNDSRLLLSKCSIGTPLPHFTLVLDANTNLILSLSKARVLLLDPAAGRFIDRTEWSDEIDRYLKITEQALGDLAINEIQAGHYAKLWRSIITAHIADPS